MRLTELPPLLTRNFADQLQAHLIFDRTECIIHASSSLRAVLRLPLETGIMGEDVLDLLSVAVSPREPLDALRIWLDESVPASSSAVAPRLVFLTAKDARTVHVNFSPVGELYWIAAFEDVTEKLDAEREMLAIAYQDRLTGVGNRFLFEHRLEQRLTEIASGELESATVLFLDLDRFKSVNDTLGHAVGDALLRLVGERLQSSLRESDTLARLGGDEFAVLLNTGSETYITELVLRVIDLVQRPYLIEGQIVNVGASIGIATAPRDGRGSGELLRSADLALYHSKGAGRGVFSFFKPAMEERARERRALELDLRRALVLRQFELHYQPQIDVESQTVIGLEGLLRWRHPQRGLVMPAEFLGLAEEIGLAIPIGDWVLKTACKEATRWPESVTVAVNISPLQFELGKFVPSVERALKAANLPGTRLEIEVTEDILLRDGEIVRTTLNALRAIGVRVAMGRFGTGLASMSQLVNFPFDTIKIDRSLIGTIDGDGKHRAIVRAISALGQSLGISTLAEGVETSEHLAYVRSEGCNAVQGFYYSKARPAEELAEMFSDMLPPQIDQRLTA